MVSRNKFILLQKWVPFISSLEPKTATDGFPWIKSMEPQKVSHKIWNLRAWFMNLLMYVTWLPYVTFL